MRLTRLLKWTCPDCGAVENEEVPMPVCAKKEPNIVESIALHCDECERKRIGLTSRVVYEPQKPPEPVNRVFGKCLAPDGP